MTHDHSALLAQLDALTGADSATVFAELIRAGLQALIEAEATDKLGAGRYERTDTRTTHRNGHRTKTVATTSGDVEVKIPKLRSGSFFPSLLERRRRIDKALYAVVMEAYVHGVGGPANLRRPRYRDRPVPRAHAHAHELSVRLPRRHLLQGSGRCAYGVADRRRILA